MSVRESLSTSLPNSDNNYFSLIQPYYFSPLPVEPSNPPSPRFEVCAICKRTDVPKIGVCKPCRKTIRLSKITDGLYLTDYRNATEYSKLVDLGIKQILTVGNDMIHRTEELKTKYIYIDDCVTDDIAQHFDDAHEFINRDVTLVHCFAGISRSPTIVIAYLMKEKKMTFAEAFEYCKSKRPIIDPNSGFVEQLQEYTPHGTGGIIEQAKKRRKIDIFPLGVPEITTVKPEGLTKQEKDGGKTGQKGDDDDGDDENNQILSTMV